ncbi:MAG: hypothetical protein L0Y72_28635 [Gemmataceae bacterium]|nr:hypothetical protein [Gemmataceae bacterium]
MTRKFAAAVALLSAFANALCADDVADAKKAIVDLYQSGKLFDKKQHTPVRAAFADLFAKEHAGALKSAFDEDHESLMKWLSEKPKIRADLLNALDQRIDNLPKALALFRQLWKEFPDKIETYASLAIATSVVWDSEKGVYDYRHHQERTKSNMPEKLVDAVGNYRYVLDNEKIMEGRTKNLPWEFLVFVVDHRTPLKERGWAQQYYLSQKGRPVAWHQDVPYDHDMLKGEKTKDSKFKPKLQDREYNLSNILHHGGVCAMQADFAARVGKSVGVPAVYCSGQSAHRGWHAWWMYIRIEGATADQVACKLISDGRFAGKDLFFTGNVLDPQSGQKMLDRDMERRLWLVGFDRAGKRQSELIMRAYPWLSEELAFDAKTKTAYLDKCLKVCPYNEEAWLEFARLAKSDSFQSPEEKKIVRAHIATVTKSFANYPDFVWKLFPDLARVLPDAKEQLKQYEKVVALFEKNGRADLACDARLKITELLVEQSKWQDAAKGLFFTINKFPTEGRYIPKLTKKLQEVVPNYKTGAQELANMYLSLIPAMYRFYEKDEIDYAKKMRDQAYDYFRANSMDKHELTLRARLPSS